MNGNYDHIRTALEKIQHRFSTVQADGANCWLMAYVDTSDDSQFRSPSSKVTKVLFQDVAITQDWWAENNLGTFKPGPDFWLMAAGDSGVWSDCATVAYDLMELLINLPQAERATLAADEHWSIIKDVVDSRLYPAWTRGGEGDQLVFDYDHAWLELVGEFFLQVPSAVPQRDVLTEEEEQPVPYDPDVHELCWLTPVPLTDTCAGIVRILRDALSNETDGLDVASSMASAKRRRGRPKTYSREEDDKIVADWESAKNSGVKEHVEFEKSRNLPQGAVRRAKERQKSRRQRGIK